MRMKKLVIAVIQNEVADAVVDALLEADFGRPGSPAPAGFCAAATPPS